MRISDWSSDVCSSDLRPARHSLVRLRSRSSSVIGTASSSSSREVGSGFTGRRASCAAAGAAEAQSSTASEQAAAGKGRFMPDRLTAKPYRNVKPGGKLKYKPIARLFQDNRRIIGESDV